MKNGPTPAFVLARATALTAPAWLPVSGLRQSAEAVSSPGSLLLHVASEGVVISIPDKALALAAGTDPGQHARLQPRTRRQCWQFATRDARSAPSRSDAGAGTCTTRPRKRLRRNSPLRRVHGGECVVGRAGCLRLAQLVGLLEASLRALAPPLGTRSLHLS